MRKYSYLILLHMLATVAVSAQETLISKEEVRTRVIEANTTLKIAETQFDQARADYRQSNALFLPTISASYTGITTTNPLMAFGSKLNQSILTQADFNPDLLNDPDRTENFATILEVQQPILNLDGLFERKAARTKMQAMSYQTDRKQEYLMLETEKAYMQLQLAYKAVEVIEKALKAAEENEAVATDNYRLGYLQKSELLAVTVRVNQIKNQLIHARAEISNTSDYLSFLMNENMDRLYVPKDPLDINTSIDNSQLSYSEDRADLKAMEQVSAAYKNTFQASKMSFLPRLNAFASYELYDNEVFEMGESGYTVGAQLSWNILEGSKRIGKLQKSRAAYEESKLELEAYKSKSIMEFEKARRNFENAKNQLALKSLSLEQAKEALRIRTNRYKEGLEKTSDLLQAETQYAQSELEYYQTIFEHNYALAYLDFLTQKTL